MCDGLVVDVATAIVGFVVVGVAVSVGFSAAGELPAPAPPSVLVADLGSSALDMGLRRLVPTEGRAAAALLILLL